MITSLVRTSTAALLDAATVDALAFALAGDGIAAHEADVERAVATFTARLGADPLLGLLADRTMPAPVRERAFGLLAERWSGARREPPWRSSAA